MKNSGNTILMTGGGSGIGAALAQRFAERGNDVVVAGRDMAKLERAAAANPRIHAMALDVDSAAGVADVATRLLAERPRLNVLFNNAGIMRYEPLDRRRDLADAEATVTTNILGPIRLTDALIDHLVAQPEAAIVNVTSGLAFVPMIDAAVYSASKAAIHAYTVALRAALEGRVEVIELMPPGVQTALTPGQEHRPGYMPLGEFIDEVMAQFDAEPTPSEVMAARVRLLRDAEREDRFDATLRQMNESARIARGASA